MLDIHWVGSFTCNSVEIMVPRQEQFLFAGRSPSVRARRKRREGARSLEKFPEGFWKRVGFFFSVCSFVALAGRAYWARACVRTGRWVRGALIGFSDACFNWVIGYLGCWLLGLLVTWLLGYLVIRTWSYGRYMYTAGPAALVSLPLLPHLSRECTRPLAPPGSTYWTRALVPHCTGMRRGCGGCTLGTASRSTPSCRLAAMESTSAVSGSLTRRTTRP